MLEALTRWWRGIGRPAPGADGSGVARYSVDNLHLNDFVDPLGTRYPPFPEGVPLLEARRLLAGQRRLLAQLRQSLGLTREQFGALIDPVLIRYAEFVHLLPASESHHHRGTGGLLRHGLEVAVYAARRSEEALFDLDASPRERRDRERRWRVATALAGLMHDVGKVVSDLRVVSEDGQVWNCLRQAPGQSLVDWARERGAQRYFVSWRGGRQHRRHEFHSRSVAQLLVPEATRRYLMPGDSMEIWQQMDEAIGGLDSQSKIARIVLRADQASVALDLKRHGASAGLQTSRHAVERYLVEAMRRLIRSGRWEVNQLGAALYVTEHGLFVHWKAAVRDVLALLAADGVKGIPQDPLVLVDLLIQAGIAAPREVAAPPGSAEERYSYRYWPVTPCLPPRDGLAGGVQLQLLKLETPELFFPLALPPAVPATLGDPAPPRAVPEAAATEPQARAGAGACPPAPTPGEAPSPAATPAAPPAALSEPPDSDWQTAELRPIAPAVHPRDTPFVPLGETAPARSPATTPTRAGKTRKRPARTPAQARAHSDARLPADPDALGPLKQSLPDLGLAPEPGSGRRLVSEPPETAPPVSELPAVRLVAPRYLDTLAPPEVPPGALEVAPPPLPPDAPPTPAAPVSARDCLHELMAMLRAGEGRWLAGPVTRGPEGLCVSAHSLQRVLAEHPHLRLPALRFGLQRLGPGVFRQHGDQLILRVESP